MKVPVALRVLLILISFFVGVALTLIGALLGGTASDVIVGVLCVGCASFQLWQLDAAEREAEDGVINWRQQDATRNSIEMAGRAYFSHRELFKVNCNAIQEMLHERHGVDWNDYPADFNRGSYVVKRKPDEDPDAARPVCMVDHEIPAFTACRDYIESHLHQDLVQET